MRLLEIIIALTILSLLSLISFSSYQSWQQRQTLKQSVSVFKTALNFAKEASILKARTTYLCASENHQTCNPNWQGDLLVFYSNAPPKIETLVANFSALPEGIQINSSRFKDEPYLYFMNNGEVANNATFYFSNQSQSLSLSISKTGIVHQRISG